jgi:adenylate cyclase
MAELKRRRVFRVASVYGATAFVVLQAADLVFPRIGLPEWTVTLVVALALIGFPLALVVAWTFDSTPEGLRRTAPADPAQIAAIVAQPRARRWPAGLAALLGFVLLIAGAAWALGYRGGRGGSERYDSIAVLPFVNMSGDSASEYFGDGMAEELLNALSGIENLKVAARTSAFALKDAKLDVRRIGDTLDVATVLEGSVRRSADRIRVTAQLIDTRTGYHIWSETYDRPLTDLFVVQDEISREIVSALSVKLANADESLYRGGTKDVRAYDKYLLGRQKWGTRRIPELREAIKLFEEAIARDSSFALGWSGLADAIDALAWRSPPDRALVPHAKYAAQRALILDPELAEAWASVGVLALDFDRDFRISEVALRRAIALKPSYASALNWLGDVLRYSGRPEESLEVLKRAVELDPLSANALSALAQTYMNLGRWSEARPRADKVMALVDDAGILMHVLSGGPQLGYDGAELERFAVAWARLREHPQPERARVIGAAIADPNLRPPARALLDECDALKVNGRDVAKLRITIGDHAGALASLERAAAVQDPTLIIIAADWAFDPVRSNPRFQQVLKDIGMPDARHTRVGN